MTDNIDKNIMYATSSRTPNMPALKPFDLVVGDTVYAEEPQIPSKGRYTVTAILEHIFTVTNGKWEVAFDKTAYQIGEVYKCEK